MTENRNNISLTLSLNILKALGGDTSIQYDNADAVWDEINKIYERSGNGINIEQLILDITENGQYNFTATDDIDAYMPVQLNINIEQKYTDEQVNELIEIARLDGEQSGYESGLIAQKEKLASINIATNGTYTREDGYNEIIVNVESSGGSGGSGLDFSQIGYSEEDSARINAKYNADIEYTKSVANKFTPGMTLLNNLFKNDSQLVYAPFEDTSNVISISQMFSGCSSLQEVPLYDTSKVTGMLGVFENCSSLQEVPLFDTSKVTSMNLLFKKCSSLVSVPLFNTSNVTNMTSMFSGCSSLESVPLFDTSKVSEMVFMFENCTSLKIIPQFNTSNVTKMSYMFSGCTSLESVPLFDTSNVISMDYMFDGCTSLESVPLFDTSNVTSMQGMFEDCSSLESVPLLDTSNVTKMNTMFSYCTSLESVPLLDTSKVTSMQGMFGYSELKKLTQFGGLKNLGMQSSVSGTNDNYAFAKIPNLTKESVLNILNNLYDRKTAGYSVLTLKLHANHLALLSDEEKAIATNKGWTLA